MLSSLPCLLIFAVCMKMLCLLAQEGLPGGGESDSVQSQVQRLIMQAESYENLCQSYIGWCPFW